MVTYYGLLLRNGTYTSMRTMCYSLPGFTTIIILIVFHIVQIVTIKKLHDDEKWIWAWVLVFAPVLLYLIFLKYTEYYRKQQSKNMNFMMYQMQQQNQPNMYAALSQPQIQPAPPIPPDTSIPMQNQMQNFQFPPQPAQPFNDGMGQMNDAYANYQTPFNPMGGQMNYGGGYNQPYQPYSGNMLNPFE